MPLTSEEFLLWLILAALTAATLGWLLRETSRRAGTDEAGDRSLSVYKDQLQEVDRDEERGLIDAGAAEAARLEISRRLLAADEGDRPRSPSGPLPKWLVAGLVLVVPVAAFGLYIVQGSPGQPSQPYAERISQPLAELPVEGLVARLEQRLKDEPEDAQGWRLIAPVYVQLGRYSDAINAFGRVMQIEGRDPDMLAGLAEALTLSGDGMIPAPARRAFEAALELDPAHAKSRFYMGLSAAQAGDLEGALAIWNALLQEAPEDAVWLEAVRRQIAAAEARLAAE